MITELISAFLFIFIAEMGDKTQILAMAFATKYSTSRVLLGVLIGSFLNHGLAIALGAYLSNFIPLDTVQVIAGFAFVGFGLWGLKYDEDEEESNKSKFGPVVTVALAFFIGELGDKTQLTAMTLATSAQFPVLILSGTVIGMIVTSGIGIFVGKKVGEKIPEIAIKIISSGVFIFLGTIKLLQTLPGEYLTNINIILYTLFLGLGIFLLSKPIYEAQRNKQRTALKEVAATLYIQAHHMKKAVDEICLGEERCGTCEGSKCLVGFAKKALEAAENEEYILSPDWGELPKRNNKAFNEDKIVEALSTLVDHIVATRTSENENYVVNKAREALEIIAFGESLPLIKNINKYFTTMKKKDKEFTKKMKKRLKEMRKERKEKKE